MHEANPFADAERNTDHTHEHAARLDDLAAHQRRGGGKDTDWNSGHTGTSEEKT
jgi:hypothetical protein